MRHNSRREFLTYAGAAALTAPALVALVPAARATPEKMQAAFDNIVSGAKVTQGRIKIDIPPLVENGNVVPVTISVESPMSGEDHVRTIHLLNERNPQPHVISVKLGPRAGKAAVSTRIRLADAQKVVALAELSDGSFVTGSADVIVTLAACVEGTL